MLDAFIENQIFYPDRTLVADPSHAGLDHREVWATADDGVRLHGWHLPARGRTLLVFFHGNAGNISHRLDNLRRLVEAGVDVYIFDYRGYGRSQGSISEAGLYADAEAALAKGRELAAETGARLALFGRSLGGVAAVKVAGRPEVAGVVLESTFTHLGDMARHHFPLPGLGALKGRFSSLARIDRVVAPKLFIHGDADGIVPLELGLALYEAAPRPKELWVIPGAGHNDTYETAGPVYFRRVADFLAGLEGG
jgi:hypothetical protein